jgi:hypothetical protein
MGASGLLMDFPASLAKNSGQQKCGNPKGCRILTKI